MKKKNIALLLSVVLVLAGAVGATIAWLTDNAGPVTNTFTVGNIDIELDEKDVDNSTPNKDRDTANSYKMIPGFTYDKDPTVTVKKNSEPCWVFVKVMETGGAINWTNEEEVTVTKTFNDFIDYQVMTGEGNWIKYNDYGVYYRKVEASDADQTFKVIVGDKVKVKDTVTKKMMDELKIAVDAEATTIPTLSFKAAAVQYYEANNAPFEIADAYALVADKL